VRRARVRVGFAEARQAGGDLDPRSGERELLTGTLDWYRAVAERKVLGLDLTVPFAALNVVMFIVTAAAAWRLSARGAA